MYNKQKIIIGAILLMFFVTGLCRAQYQADSPEIKQQFPWPEDKRCAVSLSFDDARLTQIDKGIPLLNKYGIKATFYISPENVVKRQEGWKKAIKEGHEIGNHSMTHPCTGSYPFSRENALENYTLDKIATDINEADEFIEQTFGVRTKSFAYPCGQKFVGKGRNLRSYIPLIADRFTSGRGWLGENSNDPLLCDLSQLLAMESDGKTFRELKMLIENTAEAGGWLVLAGHETDNEGSQTTRLSSLDSLCQYAEDPQNGIWIDNVTNIAAYILEQRHISSELLCGLSRMDITPVMPVTLAGYARRTELSTGIHDSLSVRVLVFKAGEEKLVIVSTDVIGFYGNTAKIIHESITEEYQLKPSQVFLTAIHTHAAPSITLDEKKGHPNNVAYTKFLQKRILQAIGNALSELKPAQIFTGTGSSPVGVNRREVYYDSTGNPRTYLGRNPSGVHDREVQVLKICQDDRVSGILFGYACHSTSLGWANYLISGDVHGLAEKFIETYFGNKVIAPGVAGASGDIDPWYRILPGFENKNGWIPEPVLLGTMLGEEVIHVLRKMDSTSVAGPIASDNQVLSLPGKPKGEWTTPANYPNTVLNVTVAKIGDIAFVGLGGEALTEIGLAIKAASPFKQTFIITHCNGSAGYLAPQHLYVEQGYEIKSSPFASTAAEIVVKKVLNMLYKLRGHAE